MSDRNKVSISDLLEISKNLVESFFPTADIYSLLVLSLVTVTTYSRKNRHIGATTRIDLAIAFLPDLIPFLAMNGIISSNGAKELSKQCEEKTDDLPLILQAYMYAAGGLRVKMEVKDKSTSKTCTIS